MSTIVELQKRAAELKAKYQRESITPKEVGQLHENTLQYIADLERHVDNLGVRKVYASKAELDDDTAPVGTNGKPMKFGQLAVIRSVDADNGNIYAYQKPGWLLIGNLNEGQVVNDLVTGGDNVPLSAEQGKVLGEKIEAIKDSVPTVVQGAGSSEDAVMSQAAVTAQLPTYDASRDGTAYASLQECLTALDGTLSATQKNSVKQVVFTNTDGRNEAYLRVGAPWSADADGWEEFGQDGTGLSEYLTRTKEVDVASFPSFGGYLLQALKWYVDGRWSSYFIPVNEGAKYRMTADDNYRTEWLLTSETEAVSGGTINIIGTYNTLNAGESVEFTVPSGARTLVIITSYHAAIIPNKYIPKSLVVEYVDTNLVFMDNLSPVIEKLESLESKDAEQDGRIDALGDATSVLKEGTRAVTLETGVPNKLLTTLLELSDNTLMDISKPISLRKGETIMSEHPNYGYETHGIVLTDEDGTWYGTTYNFSKEGTRYTAEEDCHVAVCYQRNIATTVTVRTPFVFETVEETRKIPFAWTDGKRIMNEKVTATVEGFSSTDPTRVHAGDRLYLHVTQAIGYYSDEFGENREKISLSEKYTYGGELPLNIVESSLNRIQWSVFDVKRDGYLVFSTNEEYKDECYIVRTVSLDSYEERIAAIEGRIADVEGGAVGLSLWAGKKIAFITDSISQFVRPYKNLTNCVPVWYNQVGTSIGKVSADMDNPVNSQSFLERSKLIDGNIDMLVIAGGTNDFGRTEPTPLGAFTDGASETTYTFYSALHQLYRNMRDKLGAKPIVQMLPFTRLSQYESDGLTEKPNLIGHYYSQYIQAMREVAAYWSVPVLNTYDECLKMAVLGKNTRYTLDGLHPNALGGKKIAMYLYPLLEDVYRQYYLTDELATKEWHVSGVTMVDGVASKITFVFTGQYNGGVYTCTSDDAGNYRIALPEDRYNVTASGYQVNTTWYNAVWSGLEDVEQRIDFKKL